MRQEDVVLGGEGIAGTVESVLYEGERYAARLRLADGQILRAFSRSKLAVGDDVRAMIRGAWRL